MLGELLCVRWDIRQDDRQPGRDVCLQLPRIRVARERRGGLLVRRDCHGAPGEDALDLTVVLDVTVERNALLEPELHRAPAEDSVQRARPDDVGSYGFAARGEQRECLEQRADTLALDDVPEEDDPPPSDTVRRRSRNAVEPSTHRDDVRIASCRR